MPFASTAPVPWHRIGPGERTLWPGGYPNSSGWERQDRPSSGSARRCHPLLDVESVETAPPTPPLFARCQPAIHPPPPLPGGLSPAGFRGGMPQERRSLNRVIRCRPAFPPACALNLLKVADGGSRWVFFSYARLAASGNRNALLRRTLTVSSRQS